MNVLIAADYSTPKSGNFAASILDLGLAMQKAGHSVVFMFPLHSAERSEGWHRWLESSGFPLILFDDAAPDSEKFTRFLKIVDAYHIDLIHSHFGFLHRFLLLQHRKLGVKLIFHDHMDFSPDGNMMKQYLHVLLDSLLCRILDANIISVMAKKDRAHRPVGKKRHWYVANGLSLRRSEADSRSREALRAELSLAPTEKLILFLGWDMYRKGLDVAVKAVALYRNITPDLKLGVIGVGRGAPYEHTEKFLQNAGLDPHADWILYMNDYEDIFSLNRATDGYISASRKEAFSYGILEAISQNSPVIVSDIEGTSWSWEYSKCVTFHNEDAEDCARAIREALELGRESSNAQDIVQKYSNEIWCRKIMDIYEKVLNR